MHQPTNSIIPQLVNISAIGEHLLVRMTKFVLRMRRYSYFPASGQYSDIAARFSNSDFLKEL